MRKFSAGLAYNLLLHLLFPVIFLASLQRHLKKRGKTSDLWQRLHPKTCGRITGKPLWFHAVSVGEAVAAQPLITLVKRELSQPILITTTTATGFRMVRKLFPEITAAYFPFDLPLAWHSFMKRFRPRIFICLETEIWPNLLFTLQKRRIPAVLLNGRFSPRSYRLYRRAGFLLAPVFKAVNFFGMRSRREAEWIKRLGAPPDRVIVTGNLKYDQALESASVNATREASEYDGFPCIIFASIHPPEEELALKCSRRLTEIFPRLRIILAPRHPEKSNLRQLLEISGRNAAFFSTRPMGRPPKQFLVLDAIGYLGGFYKNAAAVFVGGSIFPAGGQNILEPAAHGKPVAFGPHTWDFREESTLLLSKEAAVLVRNEEEVTAFFHQALSNQDWARAMGCRALLAIQGQAGAARRSLEIIRKALELPTG